MHWHCAKGKAYLQPEPAKNVNLCIVDQGYHFGCGAAGTRGSSPCISNFNVRKPWKRCGDVVACIPEATCPPRKALRKGRTGLSFFRKRAFSGSWHQIFFMKSGARDNDTRSDDIFNITGVPIQRCTCCFEHRGRLGLVELYCIVSAEPEKRYKIWGIQRHRRVGNRGCNYVEHLMRFGS